MLGAAEVGMARALLEAGVRPDLVCGTSVGAINGAAIAADPTPEGARQLLEMWEALGRNNTLSGSLSRSARRAWSDAGGAAWRRRAASAVARPATRAAFVDLAVPLRVRGGQHRSEP